MPKFDGHFISLRFGDHRNNRTADRSNQRTHLTHHLRLCCTVKLNDMKYESIERTLFKSENENCTLLLLF